MSIALVDAPQTCQSRRPGSLHVAPVDREHTLESFCNVPFLVTDVGKSVPQPKFLERHTLKNLQRSSEFAGSEMFIATDADGVPLGRIAAIVNHQHLVKFEDRTAFFGFFECINDVEVARALLERACAHFSGRGLLRVVGPVNPTLNYSPGLLIDGYENPSSYSTAHTPGYYPALLEAAGFQRFADLYGYGLDRNRQLPDLRGAGLQRVNIRPLRPAELVTRLADLWSLYVSSFRANWFELPIDQSEFQGLIAALVLLGPRGYVLVAEANRRFVGFTIAAPELNDTFARVRAASRVSARAWAAIRFASVTRARVLFLGVDPEYRGSGLDGLLITGIWESCQKAGVHMAEASWILEHNYRMRSALRGLGFRVLKRWRLYSRPL